MSKSYYKTYSQLSKPEDGVPNNGRVFHAKTVDDVNSKIRETNYSILDIYANWCGPCKSFKPIFAELSQKYTDINFIAIDIDLPEFEGSVYTKDVTGVPTFSFYFNNGGNIQLINQIGGGSRSEVEELLSQMTGK